ncbi:HAD-IA family hydrolase [Paenibacillus sp. CGMCC 1.16610]|uniref:HAD-IA family hydrolase n=1 Tax=Paenibacillus anseongense TaxID=2682845 RepID=A0ABW9U6H4_9BACL|nr:MULTISPECIES: HAD-IA family hydrolase [Paenibacillus]MBA2939067.1 HAD-IA family hydrolase [Paenibacillus sp. CGMCC 1.16610]MVQ35026.1 HAD-IA family hydrolase [Paenibacillus anseongense]
MADKELVLDIGGVLATNFSPHFWKDLSEQSSTPYEMLFNFRKEMREELWTGKMPEEGFWKQLHLKFPTIHIENAKEILISNIRPMPAIEKVKMWSKYANIHILSNHRIEWIKSILKPIEPYVCSITVSSEVGCCKPKPEIYALVHEQLNHQGDILFVDDQDKNFNEANSLGWKTILADEKGAWIYNVTSLLSAVED